MVVWGETVRHSTVNRRLAQLIAEIRIKEGVLRQCDDTYQNPVEVRPVLRSVITALRGRKSGSGMKNLSNVDFDFVPDGEMYESY